FGTLEKGSANSPAVEMESVHHFYKFVSGSALKRPAWFFDASQQGDAIVDVGTHLVDLVQWQCFPDASIDFRSDIQIHSAKKWAAPLSLSQFSDITKMDSFPSYLDRYVSKDTILNADANGSVTYSVKGVFAKVTALWNYKAPEGSGDTHYSLMKGTKCNLVIRQGKEERYQPTLYVEAVKDAGKDYATHLDNAVKKINKNYAGVKVEKSGNGWRLTIPESFKIGHEAHFGQVMQRYLQYLQDKRLPEWEVPCMLAKYYVTTFGAAMASGR
ncbi:MAG: putative oxidoreductase C-terminal domain-containing protein, partial [Chitinophagaceae bacterium]